MNDDDTHLISLGLLLKSRRKGKGEGAHAGVSLFLLRRHAVVVVVVVEPLIYRFLRRKRNAKFGWGTIWQLSRVLCLFSFFFFSERVTGDFLSLSLSWRSLFILKSVESHLFTFHFQTSVYLSFLAGSFEITTFFFVCCFVFFWSIGWNRNGSDNPTMTQRSHLPSAPSGSARFGMASQLSPTTTSGSGSTSAFRSALTTASPGGSLSAPSSPSRHKYGGSSTSAIPLMTGRKHPVAIQRNAPPPNICVEKGRIEFVKSAAESTTSATNAGLMAQPPVSSALHPHHVNSSSKLVMGAKIFRPHPPPSAPTLPTAYRASMAPAGKPPPPPPEESVVKHQSKFKDSPGPTLRERSASPKLLPPTSSSRRDSTPPPPHPPTSSGTSASSKIPSRIPSAGRLTNGSKSTTSNRSRESSPIPPPSSGSGRVLPAGGSGTSLKVVAAASSSTSAVQVSPNLVRWRAKLSSSSASPSSSSPSAGNSGQSSKSSAHAKTAAAVTSPSTSLNPQRPHQAARPKHPDDSPLPVSFSNFIFFFRSGIDSFTREKIFKTVF